MSIVQKTFSRRLAAALLVSCVLPGRGRGRQPVTLDELEDWVNRELVQVDDALVIPLLLQLVRRWEQERAAKTREGLRHEA